MQAVKLNRELLFIIDNGKVVKKIFKLFFSKESLEIYLSFPYCTVNSYKSGKAKMLKDSHKLEINTSDKNPSIKSTIIPLKLSYHLDGQVHFKPTEQGNLLKSYKLSEVKSKPLIDFTGQHMFTITLEGLDIFKNFDLTTYNVNKHALAKCNLADCFKIVGYAGQTYDQVNNKYKDAEGKNVPYTLAIQFERPNLNVPFILGLYIMQIDSLKLDDETKSYLNVMSGFTVEKGEIDFIYLVAD